MRVQESFKAENQPCLYLCSTPIGNLQDVTFRLLNTLREADVIACEDTRQTRKLLSHYEISASRLVSYHQHNEAMRQKELAQWWAQGYRVALVSDAGTPGISDPGYLAVQSAIAAEVPVIPIPGCSAALAALVASGIAPQPFLFVGFLPRNTQEQRRVLRKYQPLDCALIVYESPHRILATLELIYSEYGARQVTLARELTKKFETFIRGTLDEIIETLKNEGVRGEFVIVLGPPLVAGDADKQSFQQTWDSALERVRERMAEGVSHSEAVTVTAEEMGVKRRALYQATLAE